MAPASPLEAGARIGRFIVLETLGAGAMGVVVAARDPDLDRRVAIKIVQPHAFGPDGGAEACARLLREARAMAQVVHPNILTVYEAGAFGDEVFIAMEHAGGGTLRSWGEAETRPWRQILDVHLRAGRGLWAAHQAGLVHRDYKPDNVLLTQEGSVRVADFGLVGVDADAGGDADRGRLGVTLTQTGTLVGTPAYMAPEQHRRETATAASDQFAFCVALYEGLYGERPFSGATYPELSAAVIAGRVREAPRGAAVPAKLRALLLRGLAVDPADRFPSMGALLDALDRVRRGHRRWTLAAMAVLATGAGGAAIAFQGGEPEPSCKTGRRQLAGVWDEARRAEVRDSFLAIPRPYAADSWTRVEAALDRYAESWAARFDAVCADTVVHAAESEEVLALRMSCLHDRKRDLGALTEVLADADESVVQKATSAVALLEDVDTCNDVDALRQGYEPPREDQKAAVASLREQVARAEAMDTAGRYAGGLRLAEEAVAQARTLDYAPVLAEALTQLGRLHKSSGNDGAAATHLEEAVWAADAADHQEARARAAITLIFIAARAGKRDDWVRWSRLAQNAVQRAGGRGGPLEASFHINMGSALNDMGDPDEAISHLERALAIGEDALGAEHPYMAIARENLGISWSEKGDLARALEQHERALAIRQHTLGSEHPEVARSYLNRGVVRHRMGRVEEALRDLQQAIAIGEAGLGADHPAVGMMFINLGEVHRAEGEHAEALAQYRRALASFERSLPPGHPWLAGATSNLGLALLGLGRAAEAVEHFERAIAACPEECPARISAEASFGLARALRLTGGDPAEAVELARKAREEWASLAEGTADEELRAVDAFLGGRDRDAGKGR